MDQIKSLENKHAVIYCRVSTIHQVEEGNSLATQERLCREYALKHGFNIVETFIEQGESAKTTDRTELQRLLSYCTNKKNNIQAVITYRIDRISRNSYDYSEIRLLLKSKGVEIRSTSENFENTPAGRFMENIISNVSQFDNDIRTERSVNGMKDASREGRYVWMAPIGYKNVKLGGRANIEPDGQSELIQRAFKEVAQELEPIEWIRQKLIKEGLKSRYGKPPSGSHFYKILQNPIYKGCIVKFGETHKGTYTPLISEELFDQVQRVLKKPKGGKSLYVTDHPDFPLRRFVFDENTGYPFTGAWSRGRYNKKYPYYRSIKAKRNFSKDYLEKHFKHFLHQYSLNEKLLKRLKDCIDTNLVKETKQQRNEGKKMRKQIEDLLKRQSSLLEDRAKGYITGEVLKRHIDSIEEKIHSAQRSLFTLQEEDVDIENVYPIVSEFLNNPGKLWENLSIVDQRNLQSFEFPKGVSFDGKKFRTKEVCRIFKLKSGILNEKFYRVHSKKGISKPKLKTKDKRELKLALLETYKFLKDVA